MVHTHPRDVFAEMKRAMPSLDNITWERLEREDSVTYPCDAEDQPGNDIVLATGSRRPRAAAAWSPPQSSRRPKSPTPNIRWC